MLAEAIDRIACNVDGVDTVVGVMLAAAPDTPGRESP